MNKVAFVDKDDNVIGAGTKEEYIANGIIHRIARVFIFNTKGEVLIQKRAANLKAYPGMWDQSVAVHVDEGEEYDEAAQREMEEEIGLNVPLTRVGKYYSEDPEKGVLKKRFSMLYIGTTEEEPHADSGEVSELRWIPREELRAWINDRGEEFTPGAVNAYHFLEKNGF